MFKRGIIYLDHHAHAPMDPRVAHLLIDAFQRFDANPSSSHAPGEAAWNAVEAARAEVADLLAVEPAEVVFTSGATESNNMVMAGHRRLTSPSHNEPILVASGEHRSVLVPAAREAGGAAQVPLTEDGTVRMNVLESMLLKGASLVSIAAANHEIGTIQPIAAIGELCRRHDTLFHSDLAQAAGKIRLDLHTVDFASVSSHKLGGPTGVGALIIRRRHRRHFRPTFLGGGQEGGLRPGTVPVPLCVAFGEACRLARTEMDADAARIAALRDELLDQLATVGGLQVNGGGPRLPGNLNVSFDGVDGEALAIRLRDSVAISTGSACTSASLEPSHVLIAIGLSGRRAEGALRFGLGRSTTADDVAGAAEAVIEAVTTLRSATSRRAA